MSEFALESGGTTRCGPLWSSAGWAHEPCHKLYAVCSGSGRYAIPGEQLVLQPDRLYLIPGNRRHRHGPADDMLVHWLHVRCLSPVVELRLASLSRMASWPMEGWRWWQPAWESIPGWFSARDLAGELRLQALVAAVVSDAIADAAPTSRLDPRLEAALRWMDAHCLTHPPLEAAARIAGLAPAVFHRRFTAAVGSTPRGWLEARRLDHARRLLREPGASVQAVAKTCGYANPFHFSRVMRRRLGASPTQVRGQRGP